MTQFYLEYCQERYLFNVHLNIMLLRGHILKCVYRYTLAWKYTEIYGKESYNIC